MTRTDGKRTTERGKERGRERDRERERERERERDRERETAREREREDPHQRIVNRNRHTTPKNPWLIIVGQIWEKRYVSCNSVWLGNMCPSQKNLEVANPICKVSSRKKVARRQGIELITSGFGCHILTSIPLKLKKLTLLERTLSSSFCNFVNSMSKVCTERKNRTRRPWLLVCCRNFWSNEELPDYAFQKYISANPRTCRKHCDCNFQNYMSLS